MGPVFKVERKHGYGADFSVRHRTASPCAGPVLNVERKHHYKAPLTQPHQRDLRAKSNTPTYEVSKSHHYQGSQTHKSDLTSMVGPIYNTGKLTKHNFSGGYVAPKARADQVELVSKFFKGDKTEQSEARMETRTETHQSQQIEQIETKSTKVEFAGGEERRKEALDRRQEFLKQQEDLHMKITSSSQYNVSNAKSRQQLEEEREAYIKNAVLRVQEEALMLSNRAKEEENKRIEYIRMETERIAREDILRAEAMVRAEEERKLKEMARQEEMKRQQAAMSKQREELEKMRLLKKKQEEEKQRSEKLRLTEERKMVKVEKTEMSQRSEESNHLAELKRQEEMRLMERQRLEQMIIKESKVVEGQVAKRSDDVHGLGWGNVTTGFVSRKKLGFLQRDMSMERDSIEGSPGPGGFGNRARGLRVTFADSPGGSRPGSGVGWSVERVADMDSQGMRAETPPLAGEWAVSKGSNSEFTANGSSSLVQIHGSGDIQSSSFQSNGASNMQSSQISSSMSSSKMQSSQMSSSMSSSKMQSSQMSSSDMQPSQMSSLVSSSDMQPSQMSSSMSASKQASSFQSSQSSTQKSSFSSSQSSSFQSSSIKASTNFEAFPGMGGIENLKLEEGEH